MEKLEDIAKARAKAEKDPIKLMNKVGRFGRLAAKMLATAPTEQKNEALKAMSRILAEDMESVLKANAEDVAAAKEKGLTDAFIDRLTLTPERVYAICTGLEAIADLDDPVGKTIASWQRPNGLKIKRVRTPLGVVGVIYESRPNVTADAGALCLKAGNAAILRTGSDAHRSASAIHACLAKGLNAAGLPAAAIQLVSTTDRAAVGEMLKGLNGNLDVIVPRGGKSLVKRVQNEARVPVFAHLEGICHSYVDRGADIDEAVAICLNAKLRRPGICGATETILVDSGAHEDYLTPVVKALLDAGCEVRGDAASQAVDDRVVAASEADWSTEYLDRIVSIKTVDGVDEAIAHIARYGSQHTDAILTECDGTAQRFISRVDSAIVLVNCSTQFADGGEFGMGAEIGIATGKMHARGPVGVEQLTSFKYVVRGTGQVRPG